MPFCQLGSDFNAFFTPGGSVSLPHREIRTRPNSGTLELWSCGSLDLWVPTRFCDRGSAVREFAIEFCSRRACFPHWPAWLGNSSRADGMGFRPGWLLSQRVFISFFSLLRPAACIFPFCAPLAVPVFCSFARLECDIASWAYGLMRAGCTTRVARCGAEGAYVLVASRTYIVGLVPPQKAAIELFGTMELDSPGCQLKKSTTKRENTGNC